MAPVGSISVPRIWVALSFVSGRAAQARKYDVPFQATLGAALRSASQVETWTTPAPLTRVTAAGSEESTTHPAPSEATAALENQAGASMTVAVGSCTEPAWDTRTPTRAANWSSYQTTRWCTPFQATIGCDAGRPGVVGPMPTPAGSSTTPAGVTRAPRTDLGVEARPLVQTTK